MTENPGLTVAVALAAGVLAQSVARHIRVPGIVLLLLLGVALGPEGIGVVVPASLSSGLPTLVEFGVAVILFAGGMNLNVHRLIREQRAIRRLVTLGAALTAAGGALVARLCLEWEWKTSLLFGAIVIVTGPTVVNPLVRRLRVKRPVSTMLEAEGVLGEAVGAVIAVFVLEIAIHPPGTTLAFGPLGVLARLGFGLVLGGLTGLLLGKVLALRRLVPEGLENVFILSLVCALFQGSNALMDDTGIPAVAAAGVVVGNLTGIRVQSELLEFKEQLTVMLIGLLFILLAADVRLADVYALGLRGGVAVALLLVVVRPLTVFGSTWGCGVTWKQKLFMSWMGPRGIVAAAVATAFAKRLASSEHGTGGQELTALVFLVIAVSVLSAGVMGGLVGSLLGVRMKPSGWVILGANELAQELATALRDGGEPVVCIDSVRSADERERESSIPVLCVSVLDKEVMLRVDIERRKGALAITPDHAVNYLFMKRVREAGLLDETAAVVSTTDGGGEQTVGRDQGSDMLFGRPHDVNRWSRRLARDAAVCQTWLPDTRKRDPATLFDDDSNPAVLFLSFERGQRVAPVTSSTRFRREDLVRILVDEDQLPKAQTWLGGLGWRHVASR